VLGAAAAVALSAAALAGCGGSDGPAGTGAGSLPFDARSPLEPQGKRVRVLVRFYRPSLAEAMKGKTWSPDRQRAYVASLRDEAVSTQSSLRAKDVKLGRPVNYARVWNGFAATVPATDLPDLRATGLRSEPVRRFYGATSSAAGGEAEPAQLDIEPRSGTASVALLDTGVDRKRGRLAALVERGRDAVGHDGDSSPGGRDERHGSQIAEVLAGALGSDGGKILSIRVAGLRRDPETGGTVEYGTTDELIEGLERTVDPDGDGAVDDGVPVALVGVSSPYSGFAESPEAEAVTGATRLGTLVVAPAGNEGRREGELGTVGSPAAAPDALAVAALEGGGAPALPSVELGLATEDGRARLQGTLLGGSADALRAQVSGLVGASQENPDERGRALGDSPLHYFSVDAKPRARGRLVVVPAREGGDPAPSLATRASAAAEGGAAVLVVCEPDESRALPALPDGASGVPVIGLRGEPAQRALELTSGGDGGLAFVSSPDPGKDLSKVAPGSSSSEGPTYALAPKPDLAAPGTAVVDGGFAGGTSVAAARVAATAARLRAAEPDAEPAEVAARLVETAEPAGPLLAAGGGVPDLARAQGAAVVAEPHVVAFPRQQALADFTAQATVTVRNVSAEQQRITPKATLTGTKVTLSPTTLDLPPDGTAELTIAAEATGTDRPPRYLSGTLELGESTALLGLPVGPPPPAEVSELTLVERGGKTRGVSFEAGAVDRSGDAVAVQPLGDLTLAILDADGDVERELTPPGGARNLLPGEYAYTLTKDAAAGLGKGPYRFRATAHGPAGGEPTVRTSPSFSPK
jgi:hypothetical protein